MDIMQEPAATWPAVRKKSGRLAEVEVLRAIAVIMVLIEHLPFNLIFWNMDFVNLYIVPSGFWTGVDLFFAISGFVIARSLLPRLSGITDPRHFLRVALDFWIARAWRLLPSAWMWLFLPLILCLAFNKSNAYGSFASNWELFIAGILDLANFHIAQIYGLYGSGTEFPQWSLSLEEQFYLALPVAAFFLRRWLVYPLIILALYGFVTDNSVLSMMVRVWPVAFGVLLALWETHPTYQDFAPAGLTRRPFIRAVILFLGVACLFTVGNKTLHIVTFFQEPVAIVSVALVWLASYDRGFLWRENFGRRIMEIIAARSYSLYLIHIPVYFGAHEIWYRLHGTRIPSRPQAVILVLLALLTLAAVAELNHRLLEKPLRARGKQIVAERRAARAAAAGF
jgi:peptidoglycan/LPS O-acetylase OafA/YrhL